MTTIYLIIGIVALSAVMVAMWRFNRLKVNGLKNVINGKQKTIDTLKDEIESQQEEIRKRDEMIDALQEIEIEHLKKSKKLRTPDVRANVRNASDIMRDLQAGNGCNNKDSSAS